MRNAPEEPTTKEKTDTENDAEAMDAAESQEYGSDWEKELQAELRELETDTEEEAEGASTPKAEKGVEEATEVVEAAADVLANEVEGGKN
jgi:hypothetical protein